MVIISVTMNWSLNEINFQLIDRRVKFVTAIG